MPPKRRKILLLDGSGLIFRGYYAFISRPLTTTRGENTSAIFGFLKVLLQIIRDFQPDILVAAFDLSRDTFRKKIYEKYKAQRQETPPDLKSQIPVVIDLVRKMGIPVLEMPDYEADDIIGTLAEKWKKSDDIYIVSGDKDLLQLVDKTVRAIRPQHGIAEINLVDRDGVKDTLGVTPEQVADYLAITGDASDNIPGVKGIGEKGAQALLNEYRDLDDIYAHIDKIKGAAQKKLIESKENAYLSKQLSVIRRNLNISDDEVEKPVQPSSFLNPEVTEKLEYYQLTSLINDMKKLASPKLASGTDTKAAAPPKSAGKTHRENLFEEAPAPVIPAGDFTGQYRLVVKRSELDDLISEIKKRKIVSIDTETTSTVPASAVIIGISVCLKEGEAFYIPLLHDVKTEFTAGDALKALRPVLEDSSIKKIGQNVKFEAAVFGKAGIALSGIGFDTMLAAYLLNPTRTHNNLESLVQEYLGATKNTYTDVIKEHAGDKKPKDMTLLDVPIEAVTIYACADADAALRLKNKLEPLIAPNGLDNVLYNIEQPLAPVLAKMELVGVKIDTAFLGKLSRETETELNKLEKKIYHLAGREFNINSPQQLSKIFFEELGLESVKKTDGGKHSTDEEVLQALAAAHPLPAEILSYRSLSKLKGTYMDALPEIIQPATGRVHTSFNQTITATGRLSSSDPNLQNIPVRDEIGRRIREAFVADSGCVLVSADYSQIELRVLAHFSGDANMKKAFTENLDIHRHTASLVFDVPEKDVTDEMRRRAKTVNFGIIYGQSAFGLSRQIGISVTEARIFIDSYFKNFPKVRGFVEQILRGVSETGEVRTLSGRYRKFPDLHGKPVKETAAGQMSASQRMALNTRIQGSAADIIKIAMIGFQEFLDREKLKSRLILQIHDELVVECPENEEETVKKTLKTVMENAWKLDVPLTVDIGAGQNWSRAH